MGIWKIDGIMQDYKGRKYEQEFNINLYIRKTGWVGVQLDVEITPLFCMYCNKQLEGFFKHDGSRYGHVGEVICNHCGSSINCVDHDNIVEELITSSKGENRQLIIDYHKLYGLQQSVWIALKEKTGYDIFVEHKNNEWTTLQIVVDEICKHCHIQLNDIQTTVIVTDDRIKSLPGVVNKWLKLLNYFNIKI